MRPDPAELAGYFTEDGVYHNIPMNPVQGHEAIQEFITAFTALLDGVDSQVHRQVADGKIAKWRDNFDLTTVTKLFS